MKPLILTTVSVICALGVLMIAAAQSTNKAEQALTTAPAAQTNSAPAAAQTAQAAPAQTQAASQPAEPAQAAPAAAPAASQAPPADQAAPATPPAKETIEAKPTPLPPLGPNELRLNFRNAPLESVLNYLSDAAGYIIVNQSGGDLKGKANMWSNQPVTKDEALDLLGSTLDQSGYAFVLNGRTLTIYAKSDAKQRDIPVKSSSKPEEIPRNDQIVTQIIPVKFINAVQLSRDLQPLKPDSASWSANEGGNSLIVTDTQVNIHRLAMIIQALDTAVSSVSAVRVFKLQYADAKAVASVIKDLFAPQDAARGTGGNTGAARLLQQIRGGRGGGGPGGFGGIPGAGGGQGSGDTSTGGGRAPTPRVMAVSEDRSNSVVVSAPDDQMPVIADMITQLDTSVEDVTELKVFRLKFADAQETADLLTSLFADSNSSTSSSQNSRGGQIQFGGRFGGPFGGGFGNRGGTAGATDQSARMQKQTHVVAVPDLRTGSVIVSAARDLMKQIEGMVAELDSDPAKKQQVFVFDLQNSDPNQAMTILQSLFPSQANGGMNNMRNNQNQAGTGNQLNTRASQSQNNMNRNTGFGSGRSGGGGGGLTFGN
jgi:type II secretory pathway component GspD/PulD (secretin)